MVRFAEVKFVVILFNLVIITWQSVVCDLDYQIKEGEKLPSLKFAGDGNSYL